MRASHAVAPAVELEPIIIRRIVAELERQGIDALIVLSSLDLDYRDLLEPSCKVSVSQTRQVALRAMSLLKDRHLGLRLGATANPTVWGDFFLGLMASADTHEMLAFFAEYFPSTGPLVRLHLEDLPEGLWVVASPTSQDFAFNAFLIEKTFACLAQACKRLVGNDFGPLALELALPPPAASLTHAKAVGCSVQFGAVDHRMLFPQPAVLLESGDPIVAARIRQRLTTQFQIAKQTSPVEARVRRMLRGRLTQPPTLSDLAASMYISERTLRRRLSALGLSYAALLDEERKSCALSLLRSGLTSFTEIAAISGLSDARCLRRAVKRWTGLPPTEVRQTLALPPSLEGA